MKIEKVNDHQIRCTLTKSDLELRNLKLSELGKRKLYTVNALFGGVLFHSDNMGLYTPKQDRLYQQIRHLWEAKNIRVEADYGLTVKYTLDGAEHTLPIE